MSHRVRALSFKERLARRGGVTLVELMVAMVIVTVCVLGSIGSFRYITRAMTGSRTRTIATNLAQEKMEVLRNKPYFQLLVTTYSAVSAGYTPNFTYDLMNYPPETFNLWGGVTYTRSVNVDYAFSTSGGVSTTTFTSSDTGMKKITVYVTWTDQGVKRMLQIESYYENPSVATLSTGFKGQITGPSGNLSTVLVQVVGVPKWRGYTDSGGNYTFQVAPGSYSIVASTPGYFAQSTSMLSVSEGNYTFQNFVLVPIATGTVKASQLYAQNPSLVISQVAASSVQASGFDAEYIELFNPTTGAINIGSGATPIIRLNYNSAYQGQTCNNIPLTYVSTYVPAGKYYLIANAPTFTLNGTAMTADAYYTDTADGACSHSPNAWSPPTQRDIIYDSHSGDVSIANSAGTLDSVGWQNATTSPAGCEGGCLPLPSGLLRGDQVVRFSTACWASSTYGRAYDSGNNSNDFFFNNGVVATGFPYSPASTANPSVVTPGGVPAVGSYVAVDDGNSSAVLSTSFTVTGPQGQACVVSSFTLIGVATGTWDVTAVSSSYLTVTSNVIVTQGAITSVGNAVSSPSWRVAGFNYVLLTSTYTGGFAAGLVYGAGASYFSRLSAMLVGSSGITTRTDSQGYYIIAVPTGTVTISANYNSNNGNYQTSDQDVTVTQGAVTSVPDFHLSQGGYIKGYVTSGTGPLPNIAIHATNGGPTFEDTTDATGYFYIFATTSSLAYTITPDLDTLQSSTALPTDPLTATITTAGQTVFAGTITVVGAMGTITGSVTYSSTAITTGVLVIASTAAVNDPPPTVVASSAAALNIYYAVSSQADGTYSLDVRSSTSSTYNVRAFYPIVDINSGAVTYTSKLQSGVSVGAGASVTKNFSWP